eukprot:scaffold5511_cov460-Prasinococcus_capsulatus_cf.AAC.2
MSICGPRPWNSTAARHTLASLCWKSGHGKGQDRVPKPGPTAAPSSAPKARIGTFWGQVVPVLEISERVRGERSDVQPEEPWVRGC